MVKMMEKKYITEKEFQLIPVTQVVRDFVAESGVQNGVVFVITSHTKSLLCGNHAVLPIKDGVIQCGFAQDIYLAEFDGPQVRKIFIQVQGE